MNQGIRILGLQQGAEDWKRWRDTGIGGSDAAVIYLGGLFGKTSYTLWRQKTGGVEARFTEVQQAHMTRGNELEPKAREEFIERTGIYVSPVCMQSREHSFMLASLDGLSKNGDVGVEIKAPAEKMFRNILEAGITPEYYMLQIQHQLYVSGAKEFYFWAYNVEIPPHVFLERHTPNPGIIHELVDKEQKFQRHVEFGIPPAEDGALGIDNKLLGAAGVIMLAGYGRSGKDTVGAMLCDTLNARRFAFADKLKEFYQDFEDVKLTDKTKESHREWLIKLGHGMRQISGDVWVDGVFGAAAGAIAAECATRGGMVVTDCRYLNEVVAGRRFAENLGVPFRLFWIERPNVNPIHETEDRTTSLLRSMADVIILNDTDINTKQGKMCLENALITALNSIDKSIIVSSNTYKTFHKPNRGNNESTGKKASRTIRRKTS